MPSLTLLAAERPSWRLDLLGRFELVRDGRVAACFEDRREEQLLAHLAVHAPDPVPRHVIAADLWPQLDPPAARKQLSYNLFVLRRRLGEAGLHEAVLDVGRRLGLAAHIQVDVVAFDRHVATAAASSSVTERILALEQASMLVEGDLLAGIAAPWVRPHRARLAAAQRHTMKLLAEATHGDPSLRALMQQTPPGAWRSLRAPEKDRSSAVSAAADPQGEAPPATPRAAVDPEEVAQFVAEAVAGLGAPQYIDWRRRVAEREADIEQALETALAEERYELAYAIAVPLWRYWFALEQSERGFRWIERVRSAPFLPDLRTRAQALHAAGSLAHYAGHSRRSLMLLGQAEELWERLQDEDGQLRTLNNSATVLYFLGDLESAQILYHRANARAEALGEENLLIAGLQHEAICAGRRGQIATARQLLERRLALLGEERANGPLALRSIIELGRLAIDERKLDEVVEMASRAMRMAEELGDDQQLSVTLMQRGMVEYLRGDAAGAERWLRQALLVARRSGSAYQEGRALGYLACAMELAGDLREAAQTMLRATAILRSSHDPGAILWLQEGVRELTGRAAGVAAG